MLNRTQRKVDRKKPTLLFKKLRVLVYCRMTLNQIGLAIDILGVVFLFFCGMPSGFIENPENAGNISWGDNSELEQKRIRVNNNIIKIGAYTGLSLVLIGFIIQLIAAF
ncbi:MAG: hypothetical protein HYI21_13120 [Sediminibacterium sp. Gen4]|jgi:hypothetical protein|uniref:hypothetical protein n=1 Tax=unclassified Sediminibacterium TaxID=2635961 RepID=UPI0015BBC615|nr:MULTISPECIES: hypothetical protein [unclassified Sediminibacterium]MBW0162011.1 hypothetical protein [Sediminibacterium sp.]MBW0164434.1 hypothetical protein [Sediminibacterium sp.]NWK66966.1 hypothetical protein [Sediminibacterium sp. Gen4]